MELINRHIKELNELCKTYHVGELYAFGSVVTNDFGKDSDIDFLVRFENIELMDYLDNYIQFKESLKSLFNKKIDLVEQQAIENPVFQKNIDRSKRKLYG
ncbi:MAG: nucleotidyltransferase domain-containing protein [Pricia sp.]